jgi:hypothetical protein
MAGIKKIAMCLATVFISVFMLFYIFDNINKVADSCKRGEGNLLICEQLSGFTLSMLVLLLIVGGFLFMIVTVAYLLLAS